MTILFCISPKSSADKNKPVELLWWLGICLQMHGIQVWSLVGEDPTCRRATKPVSYNPEPVCPRACVLQQEKLLQWEAHAPQREKALKQQQRPSVVKN